MELKQSDYERLGRIYGLEQQIEERNAKFAEVKAAHRKGNKELTDQIMELKKEIASPVETPELPIFTAKEQSSKIKYPEGEEKITIPEQEKATGETPMPHSQANTEIVKPKKAREKAKGDTMKVERTLLTVFPVCGEMQQEEVIGCCQCQLANECEDRIIAFGDAAACESTTACSSGCPRVMQKKDIEEVRDRSIEGVEKAAQLARNAAKAFLSPYVLRGDDVKKLNNMGGFSTDGYMLGIKNRQICAQKGTIHEYFDVKEIYDEILAEKKETFAESAITDKPALLTDQELYEKIEEWYRSSPPIDRTVSKIQRTFNLNYNKAAEIHDRIIDESFKPAEDAEKTTDKNVCATLKDWERANIAKVPDFTVHRLDLENKRIFVYNPEKKEFEILDNYKTKKKCLESFNSFMLIDSTLNIDRPGKWPRKIAAHTGEVQKILFRADFHGSPYDHKQIRFIYHGMNGFGKPRKFTNLEQYNADLALLRKNPSYIEG